MRLPFALVSAAAYALGRPSAPPTAARGAASEPPIVEPWRSAGIPDDPDPIAEFVVTCLKPQAGAGLPASAVFRAYERWSEMRGRPAACAAAFLDRLSSYATVKATATDGLHLVGHQFHRFVSGLDPLLAPYTALPTPLRAIPGVRARVLADAALLSAELLAVLQSTRDVLEAGTDDPGTMGDVIRMAAAMLDDALADAAAPNPQTL